MRWARARSCGPPGRRTTGFGLMVLLAVTLVAQPAVASVRAGSGTAASSAIATPAISVTGSVPYTPDSAETVVTPPSASCSRLYKAVDLGLYVSELAAFKADGAPDAANLLAHWWAGSGQPVNYGSNSDLAVKADDFPAFEAMNSKVQAYIREKLAAGLTSIHVPASHGYSPTTQLPLVVMDFNNVVNFPSLYWAFRATQGIRLTGSIRDQGTRYTGKLTYVISDTYGFEANDTSHLTGAFTRAMNYLQTNCGHPKFTAGPLWFSDTLTVAVNFSAPGPREA
jgi:hypothetical protein